MISVRLAFYCAWFSIIGQVIYSHYPTDFIDDENENEDYLKDDLDVFQHSMPETVDYMPLNNGDGVIFFRNKHRTTEPPFNDPINQIDPPYSLQSDFLLNYFDKTINDNNDVNDDDKIVNNNDQLNDDEDEVNNQMITHLFRVRRSVDRMDDQANDKPVMKVLSSQNTANGQNFPEKS